MDKATYDYVLLARRMAKEYAEKWQGVEADIRKACDHTKPDGTLLFEELKVGALVIGTHCPVCRETRKKDGSAVGMHVSPEEYVHLLEKAVARLLVGDFRRKWLEEAEAIWSLRTNTAELRARMEEAGGLMSHVLIWAARCKELLTIAAENTAQFPHL